MFEFVVIGIVSLGFLSWGIVKLLVMVIKIGNRILESELLVGLVRELLDVFDFFDFNWDGKFFVEEIVIVV